MTLTIVIARLLIVSGIFCLANCEYKIIIRLKKWARSLEVSEQ